MKKLIPALALLVLLAGCGPAVEPAEATDVPSAGGTAPTPTSPVAQTPDPEPVHTPEPAAEPQPEDTAGPVLVDPVPMPTESLLPEPEPNPDGEEGPTDEAVLAVYRRAVEAFGWFQMRTLPTCPEDSVTVGEIVYHRVNYPGLSTLADLRGYLKGLFSDELVEQLLPPDGAQYVEIDGALYVQEGDRGSDITRGGETLQVLRDGGADRRTVRVTVEVLDPEAEFAVTGSESYDFPYEKVGDNWIFTNFSLVR